jgi:hypothetical protein
MTMVSLKGRPLWSPSGDMRRRWSRAGDASAWPPGRPGRRGTWSTWCTRLGMPVSVATSIALARPLAHAEPLSCDDVVPADGNDRYSLRGNRCEGLYRPYTAADVRPSSLSIGHIGLPERNSQLVVDWAPLPEPSLVVVESSNSSVSYRAKTLVAAGGHEFAWPKDIVARAGVSALAVFVRSSGPEGDVYPSCGAQGTPSAYELTFSATEPLTHVIIKIIDGKHPIWRWGPSDPSSRDIQVVVPLATFPRDDTYQVTLVANKAATDFRLRHRAHDCD